MVPSHPCLQGLEQTPYSPGYLCGRRLAILAVFASVASYHYLVLASARHSEELQSHIVRSTPGGSGGLFRGYLWSFRCVSTRPRLSVGLVLCSYSTSRVLRFISFVWACWATDSRRKNPGKRASGSSA